MFIKRMCRKPLLPSLLLIIIMIGVLFPSVLSQSIDKSFAELDGLYEGMRIRCRLLPQTYIGADFSLDPGIGNQIAGMDEVSEYYCELNCPYYFRDPGPSSGNSMAYGTNDIYRFASNHNLTLQLSEEYEIVDFSGNENICVVSRNLLDAAYRKVGDTVTVAGSELIEKKNEKAPDLVLTIVGTFQYENTDVPWNAIITPSACFFDMGELITGPDGIRRWRLYTDFEFTIDSSYNRVFDSVKKTLQSIIGKEWMLYSASRELYNAVQPLEKKLDMQQMIYNLVTILFLCLPAFITILISAKDKNEVLIRIIHGEKIENVFATSCLSYAGMIWIFGVLSIAIVNLFGSFKLLYIMGMMVISMFAAAVSIGVTCKTKIITLYQAREG